MTICHRVDPNVLCPTCMARPDEDCPLADLTPGLLTEPAVTAGATGVCAIDNETCESCQ